MAMTFIAVVLTSNMYVNPIGLETIAWKFYFVYIVILVIECVTIYFLFPETRGPTLEEIAHIFDGENTCIGNSELTKIDTNTSD
ncbi:hypothetical protein E8E12_000499 [Didymella heteroderae]|uniref:Major facilitator superfamily (MFS) profile domain-containing protein n=1 Tax=Didymella heteroderae TaxID=1769908 RepID=A0A9P5BU08_9PLEO|nr:hypothetical protein E8E12_000499 [Didymella heteroderae]